MPDKRTTPAFYQERSLMLLRDDKVSHVRRNVDKLSSAGNKEEPSQLTNRDEI